MYNRLKEEVWFIHHSSAHFAQKGSILYNCRAVVSVPELELERLSA